MDARTDESAKKKVFELIGDAGVAMMATRTPDGGMHSRPMVAQQKEFDGDLWFFSWADSRKIQELKREPRVLLDYSEPKNQNYVSISGRAEVMRDTAKAKELWSEPLRTWFPEGPDDPNLTLIKVNVESAEHWDSPSSTMLHAYGYLKALATGEPPSSGENEQVRFT